MTIIPFTPRSAARSGIWHPEEMSQLLSIFAAHEANGDACDWDTGETDRRDPQFYILGAQPNFDCVITITRLGNEYVLEDGQGHVVAEDSSLSVIADKAIQMTTGIRKSAVLARIGVTWIAAREFFEERVEPLLAEPAEIASHVFPQLAAFT